MNPFASPLWTGIICTLLGVWIGHRLRIGGDALDRRRVLRIRLRELALEAVKVHALRLVEFHRKVTPELQRMRLGVLEDLPLWKQRRFNSLCERFLALDAASLSPAQGGNADAEQTKQAFHSQRVALQTLLNAIAAAG